MTTRTFYLRVKRSGREADNLRISTGEAKNEWFCSFTHTNAFMLRRFFL